MISHGFLQGFVGILLEIAKLLLQNHGTHVEIHSFMLLLLLVLLALLRVRDKIFRSEDFCSCPLVPGCEISGRSSSCSMLCEHARNPDDAQIAIDSDSSRSFQNHFSTRVKKLLIFVYFSFCFVHIMVIHVPTRRDHSKTGCQWRFPSWSWGYGLNGCLCT